MKRLRGGVLLYEIWQQFLQKANKTLTRRIAHYSGHESTVINLLRVLQVADQATYTPEYGALIALELHCDLSGNFFVEVRTTSTRSKLNYKTDLPILFKYKNRFITTLIHTRISRSG